MKEDQKSDAEVVETLDAMLRAYQGRDLEGVMRCYADDPDVTALGTNLDQFAVGAEKIREAYQEDFEGFDRLNIEMEGCQVSIEGHVAWVAAPCKAAFEVEGETISSDARLTGVLVKQGNQWRIIQFHLSFPADQQRTAAATQRL